MNNFPNQQNEIILAQNRNVDERIQEQEPPNFVQKEMLPNTERVSWLDKMLP